MAVEGTSPLNTVHPLAWWGWAIAVGLAVSGTTNPLLLVLIGVAMAVVVVVRRSDAPWARSVKAYLLLALFVIAMRVFFQVLIGASSGETVLFTLPEVPLPEWAAGIRLGGEVTAEGLAATLYDGLRLAVMLWCIGAANALANPRQALKSVPAALYEASVAVVIALSVAPQLIESVQRVARARRLRGNRARGLRALGQVAMPVLSDAVERSISLAAGMEARGFGRTAAGPVRGTLPLMLGSSMVATLGAFLLLSTDWLLASVLLLGTGLLATAWGLRVSGRRLRVTSYRRHPWTSLDSAILGCGGLTALIVLGLGWLDPEGGLATAVGWLRPEALVPTTDPLAWPDLTLPMLLATALVVAPVFLASPPRPPVVTSWRHDQRLRSLRPHGSSKAGIAA